MKIPLSIIFNLSFPVLTAFADDLRDVKGPVDFPVNYTLWFILLALILAAGIFVLFKYLLQRLNRTSKVIPPVKPPHVIAYERLELLRGRDLHSHGKIKEYYSELSDIIRRYIEDRFQIRAPEMTTEEFLYSLRGSSQMTSDHQLLLKDFMTSCDMVKFAKYAPALKEMDDSFQFAKRFVDETKQEPSVGTDSR